MSRHLPMTTVATYNSTNLPPVGWLLWVVMVGALYSLTLCAYFRDRRELWVDSPPTWLRAPPTGWTFRTLLLHNAKLYHNVLRIGYVLLAGGTRAHTPRPHRCPSLHRP